MKVIELLRAHVIKVPPTATLREMVDLLDLYQVLILPVVDDDGALLGTVSEEQIVKSVLGPGCSCLITSRNDHGSTVSDCTAQDLMVVPPVFADEHEDVVDTLAKMVESSLSRLPVTCNGRVAGTISRVDICQAFLEGEL